MELTRKHGGKAAQKKPVKANIWRSSSLYNNNEVIRSSEVSARIARLRDSQRTAESNTCDYCKKRVLIDGLKTLQQHSHDTAERLKAIIDEKLRNMHSHGTAERSRAISDEKLAQLLAYYASGGFKN